MFTTESCLVWFYTWNLFVAVILYRIGKVIGDMDVAVPLCCREATSVEQRFFVTFDLSKVRH